MDMAWAVPGCDSPMGEFHHWVQRIFLRLCSLWASLCFYHSCSLSSPLAFGTLDQIDNPTALPNPILQTPAQSSPQSQKWESVPTRFNQLNMCSHSPSELLSKNLIPMTLAILKHIWVSLHVLLGTDLIVLTLLFYSDLVSFSHLDAPPLGWEETLKLLSLIVIQLLVIFWYQLILILQLVYRDVVLLLIYLMCKSIRTLVWLSP